jgi:integrase
MRARPKIIDLSPPGYPPRSFVILLRERQDGRNPQYYARRTIPPQLRKTPRNPYVTKAVGSVSLERAKELAWQWWTHTERKILQEKPLKEENFSTISASYLVGLEAKTKKFDVRGQPIIALKKYSRHSQSIRLHLLPFFGAMSINDIQPDDAERWLEQRLSSRPNKKGEHVDDGDPAESERWSPPAHSTVQKDGVAFAAVIRHARLQFKIDTRFVPDLPLPPESEDTRRPRFYPDEWQRLSQALHERAMTRIGQSGPLSENSIWFRTMLFFFVLTLHGTGLRVAEAMRLKVKHLRRVAEDAARRDAYHENLRLNIPHYKHVSDVYRDEIIADSVSKLYDYRVIVAPDNGLKHYTHQRIVIPSLGMAARFVQLQHILVLNLSKEAIGDIDHPDQLPPETWLFCHLDGKRIISFDHGFDKVLTTLGLLRHGSKKRALTSLRHTYASEKIEARAAELKAIADNMGTTVEMLYRHYAQEIRELRAADLQTV